MSILHVVAPGLLTSVQEARGRPGYGRYGVSAGGALDPFAAEAANRLLGNPPDAPLLELTLLGPSLRLEGGPIAMALAGADFGARLNGQPIRPGWSWLMRAGAVLECSDSPPKRGARAYLGIAAGLQVPHVLGSPSTDLRAEFGGYLGRALRSGDQLPVPRAPDALERCGHFLPAAAFEPDAKAVVRVLPGPHVARFAFHAFGQLCDTEWRIADGADRMGYRLLGPRLEHADVPDVLSIGLPVGAIQVPGDGRPIVLLADHQPTGGYTVLATVIRADLHVLAQRRPGETVTFAASTVPEARTALELQRQQLEQAPTVHFDLHAVRWT